MKRQKSNTATTIGRFPVNTCKRILRRKPAPTVVSIANTLLINLSLNAITAFAVVADAN